MCLCWPLSLWAGLDIAGSQPGPDNLPHSATTKLSTQRANCSSHFNPLTISDIISGIYWLRAGPVCRIKKWVESYVFPCFRSGYCSLCCLSMLLVRWRMTSCLQLRDSSTKYTSGNMKMSGTELSHFLHNNLSVKHTSHSMSSSSFSPHHKISNVKRIFLTFQIFQHFIRWYCGIHQPFISMLRSGIIIIIIIIMTCISVRDSIIASH